LLCCVIYPALVTVVAQATMSASANGSLIQQGDKVVGSKLIGQTFEKPSDHPEYFWGRPSAASVDKDTGVLVSGGSNYGPLFKSPEAGGGDRVKTLREPGVGGPIPADLVTKSGSGLDPHISPEAAEIQVPRVAKARGLDESQVRELVAQHTESST